MTLTLRKEKDSPLTITELDNNFVYLKKLICDKTNPASYIESIAKVEQLGSQLVFIGTLGNTLGKVDIPAALPALRGEWQENVEYDIGDWVHFKQHIYVCKKKHKSENFEEKFFAQLI